MSAKSRKDWCFSMKKLTLRRIAAIVGIAVAATLVMTLLSFTPFVLMIRLWLEQRGLDILWTLLNNLIICTCVALYVVKTKVEEEKNNEQEK